MFPNYPTPLDACRYDAHRDQWLPGPDLTSRRFALAGASLNDMIYAVGGFDGTAYLSSVERLDPREGKWCSVGSMAGKRGGHACAVLQGKVYALGGFCNEALSTCEVYDPIADAWRPIAGMSDSRAYGAAVGMSDAVYAVGGLLSDMQIHASLLERYNPWTNDWEIVDSPGNVNPRRSFLAACSVGVRR